MRLGSSTLLALLGLAVVVQSLPIASLPIDGNAYGYDKNLTPARDNKPTLPGFNWDIPKSDKQMPLRTFLAFNPHSPDPLTLAAKGDFAYYIVKYGDTWAIHYEQFGVNTLDADLGDTYAVLGPRGEIGPSRLLLSGWSPPRTLVAAAELRYLLFRAQRLEVTLAKSDPHRKLIDEFIQAAGTEAERLLPGHKIEPHEYVFDAPGLNTFISTPTGSTTEIRPSAESREPFIAEE